MNLTLKWYLDGVISKRFSQEEVITYYLKKAKEENIKYSAFVRFHEDYVDSNFGAFKDSLLKSAPIAIKDMILTKWYVSSSWAKILENYISPYSSTCFENLEKSGGLMIGKTNCDQFGMGSTTENSCFDNTINFYWKNRIPGGSSWGSAVAVAADLCLWALGTDTGWSSRQPAAMCGVVGMKPTYGRNSRYGVVAYASSFDQVWVFTKTVEDSKILLSSICWHDTKDATTVNRDDVSERDGCFNDFDIKGTKFLLPKQFIWKWLDDRIWSKFAELVGFLRKSWAVVDEVDVSILENVLSIYYTLVPAEASVNLSRLDGIRFGLQNDTMEYLNISDYYKSIRSIGFSEETKRRILLGTFVLSSSNYEWYFLKAQKARIVLKVEIEKFFKSYDIILSPTAPTPAWKIGEFSTDPLQMYLEDLYTVMANLVWMPAISIPGGFVEDKWEKLPWWLQLMADKWQEKKIFEVANWIEKNIN